MAAEWTTTRIGNPSLSTRAWILRPLTFLPASYPTLSSLPPFFCLFDRLGFLHLLRGPSDGCVLLMGPDFSHRRTIRMRCCPAPHLPGIAIKTVCILTSAGRYRPYRST